MLSQKIQDDLMSAYQQVHEAKRGHAAGDSDVEKQASQLASDVRYKAKGKVKPGASDEEKKKVTNNFLKKKFEDVHKSYIKLSYLEKIIKNLRQ